MFCDSWIVLCKFVLLIFLFISLSDKVLLEIEIKVFRFLINLYYYLYHCDILTTFLYFNLFVNLFFNLNSLFIEIIKYTRDAPWNGMAHQSYNNYKSTVFFKSNPIKHNDYKNKSIMEYYFKFGSLPRGFDKNINFLYIIIFISIIN